MTREEAIGIIDALASGCSPFTGEVLEDHPILNDRKVIRALQTALVSLSAYPGLVNQSNPIQSSLIADFLTRETISTAITVLLEAKLNTYPSTITRFFLGSNRFQGSPITQNPLFGHLKPNFKYDSLKPLVAQVLKENPDLKTFTVNNKPLTKDKPWNSISFFTEATFCKLSAKAIDQLKVRIDDLGIHKPTETLSENQQPARLAHPKAYEPWTEKETEYLAKALSYTNDLQVLSSCFQRTESSLSSMGKKLIYEGKAAIDPEAQALNNI